MDKNTRSTIDHPFVLEIETSTHKQDEYKSPDITTDTMTLVAS
jgi:hypothetical protein